MVGRIQQDHQPDHGQHSPEPVREGTDPFVVKLFDEGTHDSTCLNSCRAGWGALGSMGRLLAIQIINRLHYFNYTLQQYLIYLPKDKEAREKEEIVASLAVRVMTAVEGVGVRAFG